MGYQERALPLPFKATDLVTVGLWLRVKIFGIVNQHMERPKRQSMILMKPCPVHSAALTLWISKKINTVWGFSAGGQPFPLGTGDPNLLERPGHLYQLRHHSLPETI